MRPGDANRDAGKAAEHPDCPSRGASGHICASPSNSGREGSRRNANGGS